MPFEDLTDCRHARDTEPRPSCGQARCPQVARGRPVDLRWTPSPRRHAREFPRARRPTSWRRRHPGIGVGPSSTGVCGPRMRQPPPFVSRGWVMCSSEGNSAQARKARRANRSRSGRRGWWCSRSRRPVVARFHTESTTPAVHAARPARRTRQGARRVARPTPAAVVESSDGRDAGSQFFGRKTTSEYLKGMS